MSAKFTPGPWRLSLVQRWPFGVEVVSENGRFILHESATCHSTVQKTRADNEAGMGFKKESGEAAAAIAEQDANARLIAAAPELLALAVRYASECSECEGSGYVVVYADPYAHGDVSSPEQSPCESCVDIRAAIAAATGETE